MVDLNVTSMHIKNPSTGEWDEISIIAGKSAYQSAVDGGYQGTEAEFNAELADIKNAAEDAETAASHYPKIVNGYWYVWDATAGEFVNTGVSAEGKDGPAIVEVSATEPTDPTTEVWFKDQQSNPVEVYTVSEIDAIDAAQDAEIGIVITGKRPSMAVAAGQFVIVRNSTISGISDGLYTANAALSSSTDVTASNLTAVNDGGLNSLGAYVNENFAPYHQIMVTGYSTYKMTLPSLSGHFIFIAGSSLSRSAILYIVVQNSGVVAVEEIQKGANFTYTVGTNELTFGNGATYAIYIKEIPIRGDSISVEPIS